jgi:hypothetical protein
MKLKTEASPGFMILGQMFAFTIAFFVLPFDVSGIAWWCLAGLMLGSWVTYLILFLIKGRIRFWGLWMTRILILLSFITLLTVHFHGPMPVRQPFTKIVPFQLQPQNRTEFAH